MGGCMLREGRVPMLVAMHHAAVYQQRMARLLDAVVCPVLHMLTSLPHQRNLQVGWQCR